MSGPKTPYPKDEIQKTIEEAARQHFVNVPEDTTVAEYLHDYNWMFLELATLRKEYNFEDGISESKFRRIRKLENKLSIGLFEAVIKELDWAREDSSGIVIGVITGEFDDI